MRYLTLNQFYLAQSIIIIPPEGGLIQVLSLGQELKNWHIFSLSTRRIIEQIFQVIRSISAADIEQKFQVEIRASEKNLCHGKGFIVQSILFWSYFLMLFSYFLNKKW